MNDPAHRWVSPCCRSAVVLVNTPQARHVCQKCHESFCILDGVPWFLAPVSETMGQWRLRAHELFGFWQQNLEQIKTGMASGKLPAKTRERLQKEQNVIASNLTTVKQILEPLVGTSVAFPEVHSAMAVTHSGQNLLAYEHNLLRDWSWETGENDENLRAVAQAWPQTGANQMLVLGAGAGRLGWDLHRQFGIKRTTLSDVNPWLILAAKSIMDGKSLTYGLCPTNALTLKQSAQLFDCACPELPLPGIDYVLMDAFQAAVPAESYDLVLTPWLVDITNRPVTELLFEIASILPLGGHWLNFGPLAFHRLRSLKDPQCWEEIKEVLPQVGFKIEFEGVVRVPYLMMPQGNQERYENVMVSRAIKVKNSAKNQEIRPRDHPEWLMDCDKPVPVEPMWQTFTIMSRLQGEITSRLDGRASVNEVSQWLEKQFKMSREEARAVVINLLKRLYRERFP